MRIALPSLADLWLPPTARHRRARRGFFGIGCDCCADEDQCALCTAVDEQGPWHAGWPTNLTLVASGGCCAPMNKTVTLTKNTGSPTPFYSGTNVTQLECAGLDLLTNFALTCSTGKWLLGGVSACLRPYITSTNWRVECTLIDCDPFHVTASIEITNATDVNCCNGTLSIDIVE